MCINYLLQILTCKVELLKEFEIKDLFLSFYDNLVFIAHGKYLVKLVFMYHSFELVVSKHNILYHLILIAPLYHLSEKASLVNTLYQLCNHDILYHLERF